ncbi:DUF6185 family protein [Streptomyces sp. NRRL B-3648]|uniref:DUF6185 family protein n=1 Tax=Streptomyces sp. NRRL B-3648 TaxID=1519493 RepID=UPI0006AE6F6D|nr:DUF6185 family protein [Streptomyces sp. NRRL B-3648]
MLKGIRWWQLLPVIVAAVTWWGCSPSQAGQNDNSKCWEKHLESSHVHAVIRFDQHAESSVSIYSDMTIDIPRTEWPLTEQLLLDKHSPQYLHAMRCLLRGQDKALRTTEWRSEDPQVTDRGGDVRVEYDSFARITDYGRVRLGPWVITSKNRSTWTASLKPTTLQNSHWTVAAVMGGLTFDDTQNSASPENGKWTWEEVPLAKITFDFGLPWQRWWVLTYDRSIWSKFGIGAWWVCGSFVIALAAHRGRQRLPSSAHDGHRDSAVQAVLQWALLSGSVAVMLIVLSSRQVSPPWSAFLCISAGLALTLVARPWIGGTPVQARAVRAAAVSVAAVGLLVIVAPQLFYLPPHLVTKAEPSVSAKVGYVLIGLAAVWLWLAAMTAWAWRFAREGQMAPASWTRRWNRAPVLCVTLVSLLLAAVAGGLLGCLCWANGNQWERSSWLVGRNAGTGHGAYVSKYLSQLSFSYVTFVFTYTWVLTGVALLALLRYRTRTRQRADERGERSALGPEGPDALLTAAVFAFTAGLLGASFAGNAAQYPFWLLLNIGSLFGVLWAGRRWSVLNRMGEAFCLDRLKSQAWRQELMHRAHEFRWLEHEARVLDKGAHASMTSEQLEARQRDMRRWLLTGCDTRKPPPGQMNVVDIALAWGPEGHWWDNAVRAARVAFWFGVPASVGLLVLQLRSAWEWMRLSHEPTAVPEVVAKFIAYQAAWAAAGFVLGALWRLLPGRPSPVRAWSLVLAYAVPACLAVLLNAATGGHFLYLLLYSLFMAVILTATSIALDTATFAEDQQYARSRFALVVSIYRLQGAAGHIAWLLGQMAAATLLWQHLIG